MVTWYSGGAEPSRKQFSLFYQEYANVYSISPDLQCLQKTRLLYIHFKVIF